MKRVTVGEKYVSKSVWETLPLEERQRILKNEAERKELESLISHFNHLCKGTNGTSETLKKLRKYLVYPSYPKLIFLEEGAIIHV